MQSLRKNLYLCTLKKRHSILDYYGKTMFYSVRLPGFGRTDSKVNGREAASKYHRHAYTYAVVEIEGHQTGVGAWPYRFSHSQSRFFLCAARRGAHALFRLDKSGNITYRLGYIIEHHHRTDYHWSDSSNREQGRKQSA